MAWCLLFVVLLMVSTAAADILRVCEEKETTGSYFALYRSDSISGFSCECVITSRQTLSFVFRRNTGGDPSTQSGNVTLRSMNGDKHNEVLLEKREEVNGSHFVLTFPKAPFKGETTIQVLQANKTFTLKCSPKVDGGSNSTNTVTQKNENKDNTKSAPSVTFTLMCLSTTHEDTLRVCEEKETTGSYFALFPSVFPSGFPCECVITSRQTLSFLFKWEAGGDHSTKSDVTLRSMNGDKYNEVLLEDREEVNGSHFVLTFPKAPLKRETSIQANKTFTLKCSPKVDSGSYSTNTVTQKNPKKDDTTCEVVVAVSCVAAVASVLFGIAVVWCVRRTRKQRLQVTDKRQDNLYDIADHLIEPRAASPPMTSLMTASSCDSGTHSANTAFHTNTTLRTNTLRTNTTDMLSRATAPLTVSETDYDTAGDTVRRPECLQHTEHDTYTTLKRDCPRGEAGTTGAAVYDQCHPPADTRRGSGDNDRPLDDTYSRLQRGQERQPVIGNIYDTTSVAVLSGF